MARYQYGSLMKRQRKNGPEVWQFRWVENGRPKSILIGTVEKLPTKSDAERAVEHLRMKINAHNPQQQFRAVTVGGLIDRFMDEYATRKCRKATRRVYQSFFDRHIKPRWQDASVEGVRAIQVENWLDDMPNSQQVKSHLRSLMHTLFNAAVKWEIIDRNPIDLIRQSRKRLKEPRILTPEEFKALLAELEEPYRTMVLTVACLGLRVSELLALQWQDVNFEALTLNIRRSVVEGNVNATKTDPSAAMLPIDPEMAEALLKHRARSEFRSASDFVFAGATGKPRWAGMLLTDHLRPAAERAKIGSIGWHTFRHTYSTWLHALGATPAVQKELLRHADIQTTMNIYTQASIEDKREAVKKIAGVVWQM